MALYRMYVLTDDDRIRAPPTIIDAVDETAAVEEASQLLDGKAIEVWNQYVWNLQSGRNQARIPIGPTSQAGEVSALGDRFSEFDPPCALIGLSSDPQTDKAQCVARGGQRLERVVDQSERAAKVRVVRVGCPVEFKKHWVVGHQ